MYYQYKVSEMKTYIESSPEQLLGTLNETERRNAPDRLYVAGDPSILTQGARASVVGSRKLSAAGAARAKRISAMLAANGVVVVSGLAEGVDAIAHTTAMKHGGNTVAVIGTPLDRYYPSSNRALQDEIARAHLLVSQFDFGTKVQRYHFPMRNRTMALLSDATFIIEAGDGSGSLHQAREALRLGRDLYIFKEYLIGGELKWPEELIQYGAVVISDKDAESVLDCLPIRCQVEPSELLAM